MYLSYLVFVLFFEHAITYSQNLQHVQNSAACLVLKKCKRDHTHTHTHTNTHTSTNTHTNTHTYPRIHKHTHTHTDTHTHNKNNKNNNNNMDYARKHTYLVFDNSSA